METANSPTPVQQLCLANLQKTLDMAMKAAEMASAEGNHKLVLQAVREVTRIITLMTKLDTPPVSKKAPAAPKYLGQADRNATDKPLSDKLIKEALALFPGLDRKPNIANLGLTTTKPPMPEAPKRRDEIGKRLPGR